jgi:ribonuclease HI
MAIEECVPPEYRKGIVIFADGKCKGNGDLDSEIGGSFMLFQNGRLTPVLYDGRLQRHVELHHTHDIPTSPVAECMTLISVLNYVDAFKARCQDNQMTPPPITILMDWEGVVKFANKQWQGNEPHIKTLRQAIATHPALDGVTVKWLNNKVMKKILGH